NAIREDRDGVFIHPFDNAHVIAGQGTAGREIMEDLAARDVRADSILVCCAGGGLAGGIALAAQAADPDVAVHTVEPAGFDDFARSLQSGQPETNAKTSGSVCDALLVPTPGVRNFAIGKARFSDGLVVTDEEALAAVRYAFETLKLVVEPGGAVALAALLTGKAQARGRTTVAMLSGGNIDAATLARALS
ncbi:MAG: pyridoxal-phosphate dependent enzyme, partial [Pseudomonadota bacterium]